MKSKVQPAADYWTNDVKMISKVQPAADYWTLDRENLEMRLCYFWRAKNKELSFSFRKLDNFLDNNKAIIEFSFHRIWKILCYPPRLNPFLVLICRILRILLTLNEGITNRYFRYSINIDKNRLFCLLIKWLLSKIDKNLSQKLLWLSISIDYLN